MKTIGAAEFRQRCLALLDELDDDGVVITKDGRPVALLLPYERRHGELIGSLSRKVKVRGNILGTGVGWEAGAES